MLDKSSLGPGDLCQKGRDVDHGFCVGEDQGWAVTDVLAFGTARGMQWLLSHAELAVPTFRALAAAAGSSVSGVWVYS